MYGLILTDPLLTHCLENGDFLSVLPCPKKNARAHKPVRLSGLHFKAGDRIRTDDVQLGNPERDDSNPCNDNDLNIGGAGI